MFVVVHIYLAGKFRTGIAPTAIRTLPNAYNIDRYKIVLSLKKKQIKNAINSLK